MRNWMLGRTAIGVLLLLVLGQAQAAVLCSWNIRNLGWNNNKHMPAVGHVANHCDWVAVQELMNHKGEKALLRELRALDKSWDVISSEAIGRGSYKEHYAFYFRRGTVDYVDGALVFLDRDDRFAREPFSARFRTNRGVQFVGGTVHVLYGDSIADRRPEIRTLASYWEYLGDVYPNTPRLLAGDFNVQPDRPAYEALRKTGAVPLITRGKTTLSSINGKYANLYDNLWVDRRSKLPITGKGIIPFPRLLQDASGSPVSHEWARDHVSDHAPVFLTLGGTRIQPKAMRVR